MKTSDYPESKEFYIKVGEELRRLRQEKSQLSVLQFADRVGMHRNLISKMEKGTGEYYVSTLKRALSFYPGMTLSKFFKTLGL